MNTLITECLKQKNVSFLGRVKDQLLTPTERKWVSWIFSYITKHGEPPTLTRFSNEFPMDFVVVESFDPLLDILDCTLKEKRNLIVRQFIQKNVEELRSGADPTKLIEELSEIVATSDNDIVLSSDFDVEEYFAEVGRVFTGIETLDIATGGINDGDLVYIVGRPQDGKTTFLLYLISRWFWEGKSVLVISNEIPSVDMNFKIDAFLSGVSVGERRSGKFKPESKEKLRFLSYLKAKMPNKIIIPRKPIRKPSEIFALVQEYKPDVVCIDGAYLMSTTGEPTAEWADLAAVSRDLKMLANVKNVPVLGVIQANRGASEKQVVGGENIAGTDAFFQDPDLVFSLRHVVNGGDNMSKTVTLSTTKNRHGVFVSTTLEYDFLRMTLKEAI